MKTWLAVSSVAALVAAVPGPAADSRSCKAVSARNAQALIATRDLRASSGLGCTGVRRLVKRYFRNILESGSCYRVPGSCHFRGWDFHAREDHRTQKLYVRAIQGDREIAFRRVDRPLQG